MTETYKRYIGGGVYAQWDGAEIVLTADSRAICNTIVIEMDTWNNLCRYVYFLKSQVAKPETITKGTK